MKVGPFLFFRIAPVIAILALAVGCAKPVNDAQVTSEIQARLASDSGLQNKAISVQAANGAVTLSGTVDSDAQREAAAKYAAAEPGVKQVINNLQVAAMAAAMEPGSATNGTAETSPTAAPKPSPSPSAAIRTRHHKAEGQDRQDRMERPAHIEEASPAPAQTQAAAPIAPAAPAAAPAPQKVTIPSGTALAVRLVDAIDSSTAQTGDAFHATLDAPVAVDGDVVIPAHYDVEGHVVNAQASGKFAGQALLVLQLDRIKVGEKFYNVQTDQFSQKTGSRTKNTAEKVGGGAIAGAILGGIFGGGKGAAIGSVAGAGAGGGVQAASKKPDVKLSSEKILTFTLQAPLSVIPTDKPAREGKRLESNPAQ